MMKEILDLEAMFIEHMVRVDELANSIKIGRRRALAFKLKQNKYLDPSTLF
jgi:hypothetical protein